MPSMVEVPCQDSTGGSEGKLLRAPIQRKTEEKEAVDSALSRTQAHEMMRDVRWWSGVWERTDVERLYARHERQA